MSNKNSNYIIFTVLITLLSIHSGCKPLTFSEPLIKIRFKPDLYSEKLSGKLIIMFSKDMNAKLVYEVDPENPHPVFTYNIENWNPQDTIEIKKFDNEWFKKYSELKGSYTCRVIFDKNTEKRSSFVANGNGYSEKQTVLFKENQTEVISLQISKVFDGWIFNETENIKEIKFKSNCLSDFWGKDMFIESAVILPSGYKKNDKKYPLVFIFTGFGSSHAAITYGTLQIDKYGVNTIGKDKVFVYMNGSFFQGYHHFADSENNGPWGKAFTEEFIPYIEEHYNVINQPSQRFLMGQSSGAWTAVWLQVNYPQLFNGTFAASPDPLDFRATGFNIYRNNANFYYPEHPDSIALEKGKKKKLYAELEDIIGEFGQIRTWEATYSQKNKEGKIARLFNRKTGTVDQEVVEHWKKYDISKIIMQDPEKYQKLLSGKLHIFVSKHDPYGLSESVELIESILKDNKIPADIKYYEIKSHNIWCDEIRSHIHNIIDSQQM